MWADCGNVNSPVSLGLFKGEEKSMQFYEQVEWFRGLWADCANVDSPVSLGLFEGENKSIYFQKSLPQLCM